MSDFDEMLLEIRKKLSLNYDLTVALIPKQYQKEFQNKIITRKHLREGLAPLIAKAEEFKLERIKNVSKTWIQGRLCMRGFRDRLESCTGEVSLETIYAELTRGIFVD